MGTKQPHRRRRRRPAAWSTRREAALRLAVFAAGVVAPLVGAAVLPALLPPGARAAPSLHAALEAAGSAVAVSLFLQVALVGRGLREPLLGLPALGFLGMGLLDLTHAVLPVADQGANLHLASTGLGAAWFGALALPDEARRRLSTPASAAVTVAACFALAAWSLTPAGDAAPADPAAPRWQAARLACGLGFALGAWGMSRGPVRGTRWLVGVAGLFAASSIAFAPASAWSPRWWSHHLSHQAGFALALGMTLEGAGALVRRLERARAGLRRTNAQLRETNDTLARTVRDLEASNAELDRYASVAAHDLREPLRTVSGYLALLREDHGAALGAGGRELLAFAAEGAARLDRLTGDLLRYARSRTGALERRPVDLAALVAEIVGDLGEAIERTGAAVRIGPLPTVPGDPVQLRVLFQNLVANALKFHRGVPSVSIEAARVDAAWRVAVQDDGVGIDPAYHERIFEPFTRLEHREAFDGTGIGLALCRRIAERHGGGITVVSAAGAGSTFTVVLPTGETHAPDARTSVGGT